MDAPKSLLQLAYLLAITAGWPRTEVAVQIQPFPKARRTEKIACEYFQPVRNTKSLQRSSQHNATTASVWGRDITSNAATQGGSGRKGRKIPPKSPSRGSLEVKETRQGGNGSLDQGFHTLAGPAWESRLQSCQSGCTSLAFPAVTIKIQSPFLSSFSSRCQI